MLPKPTSSRIVRAERKAARERDNLCSLCPRCHDLEHRHIIEIEGNPDDTLRITLLDPQTLDVLEVRDSPVPGRWM